MDMIVEIQVTKLLI